MRWETIRGYQAIGTRQVSSIHLRSPLDSCAGDRPTLQFFEGGRVEERGRIGERQRETGRGRDRSFRGVTRRLHTWAPHPDLLPEIWLLVGEPAWSSPHGLIGVRHANPRAAQRRNLRLSETSLPERRSIGAVCTARSAHSYPFKLYPCQPRSASEHAGRDVCGPSRIRDVFRDDDLAALQ